jgi:hypothetical protein
MRSKRGKQADPNPCGARLLCVDANTFRRRWISNALTTPFSATVSGSAITAMFRSSDGTHDICGIVDVVVGEIAVSSVGATPEVHLVRRHTCRSLL